VGGAQLFRAEMPGITSDRLTPRIATTARLLWGVYVLLTLTLGSTAQTPSLNASQATTAQAMHLPSMPQVASVASLPASQVGHTSAKPLSHTFDVALFEAMAQQVVVYTQPG